MEEIILGNQRIPTQLYSSKIFSFIILSDKPNSKRKIFPYKFCFLSFSLEKKQSVILYAIHTLSWKGSIFLALDLHTYTWGSYRNIWTFKQEVYNRSLNLFISINYRAKNLCIGMVNLNKSDVQTMKYYSAPFLQSFTCSVVLINTASLIFNKVGLRS